MNLDLNDMSSHFSEEGVAIAQKFVEAGAGVDVLLAIEAQEFSPAGFRAFFRLIMGHEMHKAEREEWLPNIFEAMDRNMGLAQECHREAGKTTFFSYLLPAWLIGHFPEKTSIIIRINDEKAKKTAKSIAELIEYNPRWRMVFPDIVPDKKAGFSADGYNVKDQSMDYDDWIAKRASEPQYPTFVGYGWTSGSVLGHRANLCCIVDDIHDRENTRSEKQLQEVKTFYKKTLNYVTMEGCLEIWNFTPWALNDVYHYILSTGEYLHAKTPVMKEARKGDPGAELWPKMPLNRQHPEAGDIPLSGKYWIRYDPEKWTWDRLAREYRTSGAVDFYQMMLLDLERTMGRVLKKDWLHYYKAEEIDKGWPLYFGVDYASTQDKLQAGDPDFFSLSVGAAIPGGGLVVFDGFRGILSKGEALNKVANWYQRYPRVQLIGVESIGEGRGFYTDLVLMADKGIQMPLFQIKSHGRRNKGERFENYMAPRFQMARVFLTTAENEHIKRFEEEWLSYPDNDHDDVLDSVYMLIMAAEGRLVRKDWSRRDRMKGSGDPFSSLMKRRK